MPLNRTEIDLQNFTFEKIINLMKDVTQAFEIADMRPSSGLLCVGAAFLKTAVQVAITVGAPKESFLEHCARLYDQLKAEEAEANRTNERSN